MNLRTIMWGLGQKQLARPYLHLKGQWHEMYIFFEGLNIFISTFCVCADGFQGLSKDFHYPIQLLALKLLSDYENAY
jgi:hypothetical protein